ncbi:2726_t:CDS:2 [Gigaspora margarita]|uniref:2726_t:CDS:1 n=1 Tax=Gigaspora margarita TaxID=4874 RepID=A0ABM8W1X9_GIGMA|nr:2726_t:CDS:2 [Gigaspora margarita]
MYDLGRAVEKEEELKLAVATAKVIKDTLSTSLEKFIDALVYIAGFFAILESKLTLLANSLDDKPKKSHYFKCKDKASYIISSCHHYIAAIPNCVTDLRAIPDEYDKNYVQQWLSEKNIDIKNQKISLLEWGNQLFKNTEKFKKLL